MTTFTLVLLLSSTPAAQKAQQPVAPDAKKPVVEAKKDEDCADESKALMKKLQAAKPEEKPAEKAAEEKQKDAAVNGMASVGLLPAEKVEEKKVLTIPTAQKMENCQ